MRSAGLPRGAAPGLRGFLFVAAAAGLAAAEPVAPRASDVPFADVRVSVEAFGEFRIRVDPATAPNAAAAFLSLAARGAFDGLTFHRVIPGLVIQTGDPSTREGASDDSTDAPPWRLPAEASSRTHRRGTVALAWRDQDPASAGMEWYVALSDLPALDRRGTPIGEVVEGMDVVDRIAQVPTFRDRRPLRRVVVTSARVEAAGSTPAKPDATAPDSADAGAATADEPDSSLATPQGGAPAPE